VADQVVVVGGGLAGLVAAYELHERGVPVVVLEAGHRLGGRVATVDFADGATAEGAMEEFWDTSPAYPLLHELGLPLVEQPASSSVILDGRLHPYGPGGYGDDLDTGAAREGFARWNGLVGSARGGRSTRLDRLMRTRFSSYVGRAALPALVRDWIRVVVESETAVEWDRIAALDGIEEMSPFVASRSRPVGHRNVRVAGGNERLIEALAARLPEHAIRLGCRVRQVASDVRRATVVYEDHRGRRRVEHGHHAVLTPPLWSLGAIDLDPVLDRRSRAAIASSASGSYVKVVLRVRHDRVRVWPREGDHPFPLLSDGPAGCVYFSDGRPHDRDHVVTMLIHGRYAGALTGRPHGQIVAHGVRALARLTDARSGEPLLGGVTAAVTGALVFDHRHAVAYWPHALRRSRFDHLADALRAPHGRILIGGDSTDSSHSDGAVRAGQRMAAHILDVDRYHVSTGAI
jgi:monoamine oxidase